MDQGKRDYGDKMAQSESGSKTAEWDKVFAMSWCMVCDGGVMDPKASLLKRSRGPKCWIVRRSKLSESACWEPGAGALFGLWCIEGESVMSVGADGSWRTDQHAILRLGNWTRAVDNPLTPTSLPELRPNKTEAETEEQARSKPALQATPAFTLPTVMSSISFQHNLSDTIACHPIPQMSQHNGRTAGDGAVS